MSGRRKNNRSPVRNKVRRNKESDTLVPKILKKKKKKKKKPERTKFQADSKRTFIARRINSERTSYDSIEDANTNLRPVYQSNPIINGRIKNPQKLEALFYGIKALSFEDGPEKKVVITEIAEAVEDADYGFIDRIAGIVEAANFKGEENVRIYLKVEGRTRELREQLEELEDSDPEIARLITLVRPFDQGEAPEDETQSDEDEEDLGSEEQRIYKPYKTIVFTSKQLEDEMGAKAKKDFPLIKRSEKYKNVMAALDLYHDKVNEYSEFLEKFGDDGKLYNNFSAQINDRAQQVMETIDAYTSGSTTQGEIEVKDARKDVMLDLKKKIMLTQLNRPYFDANNQQRALRPINRDLETARMNFWVKHYNALLESQQLNLKGSKLGEGAQGPVFSTLFSLANPGERELPIIFEAGIKADDTTMSNTEGEASGIPKDNPEQSKRSVATYQVSRLLGMDVIPRTEFMVRKGKEGDIEFGQAQGVVRGIDGQLEKKVKDLTPKEVDDMLEFKSLGMDIPPDIRINAAERTGKKIENVIVKIDPKNPAIQKGLSDLQVLDNIIGHADRHPGNFIYEMDNEESENIIGIKGIDNDDSFGVDWAPSGAQTKFGSKTPGLPPIVDINTAINILSMDGEAVVNMTRNLSGKLGQKEVERALDRFIEVQKGIREKVLTGEFAASPGTLVDTFTLKKLARLSGAKLSNLERDLKTWGPALNDYHRKENSYLGEIKERIKDAEQQILQDGGEPLPLPKYKKFEEAN